VRTLHHYDRISLVRPSGLGPGTGATTGRGR
jgi:DNA-binding transcriptional MerR regulator